MAFPGCPSRKAANVSMENVENVEKAFANEIVPRDKGNGIHLDCPYKQSHNKRTEHVYK